MIRTIFLLNFLCNEIQRPLFTSVSCSSVSFVFLFGSVGTEVLCFVGSFALTGPESGLRCVANTRPQVMCGQYVSQGFENVCSLVSSIFS